LCGFEVESEYGGGCPAYRGELQKVTA